MPRRWQLGHSWRKQQHAAVDIGHETALPPQSHPIAVAGDRFREPRGSLEYYDFIIYSIFARDIARQFFPTNDSFVSLILSFSVLALGFLARPLGGIVPQRSFGQRAVFLASLFFTTAATRARIRGELGLALLTHAIDSFIGRQHGMSDKLVIDHCRLVAITPYRMPRPGGGVLDVPTSNPCSTRSRRK